MENLQFNAKPERHVVTQILTTHSLGVLLDAVDNASAVIGCRVWLEIGQYVICDDAAVCDTVRQFVEEYLDEVPTYRTFIGDVQQVEDMVEGELAFPRPGERWVVYPMGGQILDDVSHLIREGDTIYAVGATDQEHYRITGSGGYVIQLR